MVGFANAVLSLASLDGAVETLREHYRREGAIAFAVYGKGGSRKPPFQIGSFQRAEWLAGFNAARSEAAEAARAAQAAEAAEAAAKEEQDPYRYLPGSWRARDKLAEAIGETAADLVKDLIEAMIAEAKSDDTH